MAADTAHRRRDISPKEAAGPRSSRVGGVQRPRYVSALVMPAANNALSRQPPGAAPAQPETWSGGSCGACMANNDPPGWEDARYQQLVRQEYERLVQQDRQLHGGSDGYDNGSGGGGYGTGTSEYIAAVHNPERQAYIGHQPAAVTVLERLPQSPLHLQLQLLPDVRRSARDDGDGEASPASSMQRCAQLWTMGSGMHSTACLAAAALARGFQPIGVLPIPPEDVAPMVAKRRCSRQQPPELPPFPQQAAMPPVAHMFQQEAPFMTASGRRRRFEAWFYFYLCCSFAVNI